MAITDMSKGFKLDEDLLSEPDIETDSTDDDVATSELSAELSEPIPSQEELDGDVLEDLSDGFIPQSWINHPIKITLGDEVEERVVALNSIDMLRVIKDSGPYKAKILKWFKKNIPAGERPLPGVAEAAIIFVKALRSQKIIFDGSLVWDPKDKESQKLVAAATWVLLNIGYFQIEEAVLAIRNMTQNNNGDAAGNL